MLASLQDGELAGELESKQSSRHAGRLVSQSACCLADLHGAISDGVPHREDACPLWRRFFGVHFLRLGMPFGAAIELPSVPWRVRGAEEARGQLTLFEGVDRSAEPAWGGVEPGM